MQSFLNEICLTSVFDNLKRPEHVLIVLIDPAGNYLLGDKPKFYPNGIFRFPGGGVNKNETADEAVVREFEEELGIKPNPEKFKKLAKVTTTGAFEGKNYINITYLYQYNLDQAEDLIAGDDIEDLVSFSASELRALIDRYQDLKNKNWFIENGRKVHSWSDYGKMYGFIHQAALDLTQPQE